MTRMFSQLDLIPNIVTRVISKPSARRILALGLAATGVVSAVRSQGSWKGPYDWSCQLQVGHDCVIFAELSHAALIPSGPYQGQVLLWREPDDPDCHPIYTGEAWVFDPANPWSLVRLEQTLQSNIFCGGASWDSQSELVICGGDRNTTGYYGKKTYRFRPLALGPKGPDSVHANCSPAGERIEPGARAPFLTLGNSLNPHYYPSVIALSKRTIQFNGTCSGSCGSIVGGAHLILGGPIRDDETGQDVMSLLPYRDSAWRSISFPGVIQPCPPPMHTVACSAAASAEDRYVLRSEGTDPLPSPLLDSYPRAFQLSNGDILIAFDLITDGTQTQPNDAAAWWVMKLYETGTNRFELWRGNSQTATPDLDRNYGGAVLMHQADALHQPRLDRVILLGGASLTAASASVQEFEPLPPPPTSQGGTVVNGILHAKLALSTPRNFHNAITLPTGMILLTQGSQDPVVGTGSAIVQPELYDPGRSPTDTCSRTLMSPSNQIGTPGQHTSRTYHHIAVLLPDGRVFIAGGEAPGGTSSYANGQYSGEIFSPPYLQTGFSQPVIQDVDTTLDMSVAGSPPIHFTILVEGLPTGFAIDRVVLTRPAAVTHGFDSDQRYIELGFTSVVGGNGDETLTVESLVDNLGPPGMYMLWVVANNGTTRVPSTAVFVRFM